MKRYMFLSGLFFASLVFSQPSWASSATQFIRIPATLFGPSGLMLTQSIDTLPQNAFEFSLGVSGEDSDQPNNYTELTTYATIGVGLSSSLEATLQVPYVADSNKIGSDENDIGDVNLSIKWRFLDPNTNLTLPGFAVSITGFFPTGDPQKGIGEVDSWGVKALLISSAEVEITLFSYQLLMGVYADGGVFFQDSGDPTEEQYGVVNLGFLLPLNETRQLQLLLEGNAKVDRQTFVPANANGDYKAVTSSLRYVAKQIALTAGWQHRFNENPNDDSDLLMLQGSFIF